MLLAQFDLHYCFLPQPQNRSILYLESLTQPWHKRTNFQPGPINTSTDHPPTPPKNQPNTPDFFNSNMNINTALMSNFPSFTGSYWK